MDENKTNLKNEEIIEKVRKYLKEDRVLSAGNSVEDSVRELCVARLCKAIGIRCDFNYRTDFFQFFSAIMGEAVSVKLNLKLRIASDVLRLFKHKGVNLVERTLQYLDNPILDEAFIDTFNLVDDYKYLIDELK